MVHGVRTVGELEVDAALDATDPEMRVTHWTPLLPPPLPEELLQLDGDANGGE